jgi:hypothetical protein
VQQSRPVADHGHWSINEVDAGVQHELPGFSRRTDSLAVADVPEWIELARYQRSLRTQLEG